MVLIGAIIRDYFNAGHAGGNGFRVRWQWPVASLLILTLAFWAKPPSVALEASDMINDNEVQMIVTTHCTGCHAAQPTTPGFLVRRAYFRDACDVEKYKQQIYAQRLRLETLPPGNTTQMTRKA